MAGCQIERLQANSPAALANLHNDDYIIEVDGRNIETQDYRTVRDDVYAAYRRNRRIELLVVDEDGYEWYKERNYRIDPTAREAKVTK